MSAKLSRRLFLSGVAAVGGTAALAGCSSNVSNDPGVLQRVEELTKTTQRFFLSPRTLAREFGEADISPAFRANGTTSPKDEDYLAVAANGFADWRLQVGGLVERPMDFSLADLRALPARTQITRHDCVEGWSCIGKWKGVQLARVLDLVQPKQQARFVVFRCADTYIPTLDDSGRYYESLDVEDAYHPQTILAYEMNGATFPVAHGAPLRLRVERQLGYKMAKYVMAIDVVDSFAAIAGGKGGFWEDYGDYQWYAGI